MKHTQVQIAKIAPIKAFMGSAAVERIHAAVWDLVE